MKKRVAIVLLLCVFSALIPWVKVFAADQHSYTYTYDYWGNAKISPDGYEVSHIINGYSLGLTDFSGPEDIFIDDNGIVYLADTGNNRIVIFDQQEKAVNVLDTFVYNGVETVLNTPTGVFANKNGEILIADRLNKRVLKTDLRGVVLQVFKEPETDLDTDSVAFTGVDYLPDKVIEDSNGIVYVLCSDVYDGALMYSPGGEFLGYYGANKTEVTVSLLVNHFWRKFMTAEQRAKTGVYFPYQFDNFYIDKDEFIYTCTELSDVKTGQIKKLNAAGTNVLMSSSFIAPRYADMYGDLKIRNANGKTQQTFLTDVTVDDDGFITAVDYDRGHIFQYDKAGNLLMIFGGPGEQNGYFSMISSVENNQGNLFVLDRVKNNITVFSLTEYGKILHEAVTAYNRSEYKNAEPAWREILKRNRNFQMGYSAIGKIYYEKGDWKKAMSYFKKANDHTNYDKAYENYRNGIAESVFFPIIFILFAIGIIVSVIRKILKRKRAKS